MPAVILYINSPGGSVAGGESLHDAIARVAAKKPVVAVMGGTAASAGYMIAMPAARIFAREGDADRLDRRAAGNRPRFPACCGKIGVDAEAITSGPLKDQPSFIRPLSPAGREVLQGLVMDMYDQFVGMVAAGPSHATRPGAPAGRRARLYRAAGAAARAGRPDRRRAGGAGVAGDGEGHSADLPVEDVSTAGIRGARASARRLARCLAVSGKHFRTRG